MPATTRKFATALLSGALMVSGAWAGASLVPVSQDKAALSGSGKTDAGKASRSGKPAPAAAPSTPPGSADEELPSPPPDPSSLDDGQVLAGAAKTSIRPRPEDYNGTWERSKQKCATLSENAFTALMDDPVEFGDHLASAGSPWPENPNCIYMGGFGIGPMNPVTSWNDEYGLWVRALAMRDRQGDDLVMVILDGEGYFREYGSKCDDCGLKQIAAELASDDALGLEPKDIVVAATHAHSSPDFIGGWGFVPDWYMHQMRDTIKSTIREAMSSMEPAELEYGEHEAREFNSERRDTYRSAEEDQLVWLRAYEAKGPNRTIATVGAYAAHPTAFGTNGGEAHPDWPGLFEKSLEDRFGGVGMHFMTGLGNISNSGLGNTGDPNHKTGADDLAALVDDQGEGDVIDSPDIRTASQTWDQPVTNVPLTALGAPGFFDRKFVERPSTLATGKDPSKFQCTSASAMSAEVAASAARIGSEFAITAAPGEVFSNWSNTVKEKSRANATMPLGQAGDALGYMPQSFEMSQVGQQGLGFADPVTGYVLVNYEDSYAIDKCFGDMALETSLGLLNGL